MPVKFSTFQKEVKLDPGQSLHFQKGKGYYAGPAAQGPGPAEPKSGQGPGGPYAPPAPRRVVPPPIKKPPVDPYAALGQSEIDRRAGALAQAGLTPQQDEVRRQQALAAQRATADEAAIQGFQTAAGGLLKGIPGEIGAAYQGAAATEGAIGAAVGGQVGQDLAAKQAAGDAFAASQGQSGGHTTQANDVGTTVGMLGGVIPGSSLAEEGAARQASAAENIAIPLNAGREELAARMSQAVTENDGYAQQLIALAAQFPGLKAQALQQLNQYEIDKANYRRGLASDAETRRVDTSNMARQDRAELASEKAAGVSAGLRGAEINYRWATLNFQSQKALNSAKAAAAKGKRIDVSASRLLGHIVYQDGTEDKSIKVKQTTGTATDPTKKAQYNRAKATQVARQDAFKYASTLRGKPVPVDKKLSAASKATGHQVGLYQAGPNEKYGVPGGVFPPDPPTLPYATTNNPNRALHAGGGATDYADAQTKTWAQIGGDSLMARYGYSKEQVMAIVNRALAAAGWKK